MPQRAVPLLKRALEYQGAEAEGLGFAGQTAVTMALLGTAYLKAKHSRQAVDCLQQAVEAAPDNKRIYRAYLNALFIRGIRLCRNEEYDLGAQMLRFVLENGADGMGDIPLLRLELGRACRETGRLEEALEHYSHALEHAPGDMRIRWYRASILMSLDRNREALEDIALIRSSGGANQGTLPTDLSWNSELVDRVMIRSFLESGEWRQAADAARNWLRRWDREAAPPMRAKPPVRAAIHAMYAEAQRNLKELTSAQNHLDRAVELDGEAAQLWYAMLITAWEGEDWQTLKRALDALKRLNGEGDIIERFSALYAAKTSADDAAAITRLQDAIRALGGEPELMYALGERCLKIGLIEQSILWFEKTIALEPDHEKAHLGDIAALEALHREGERGMGKRLDGAYRRYLTRWPDNHALHREWALFLIHTNEFKRAIPELEALLPREPANPTLRRLLAYGYRKTGRYREAAVFLKALLKESPRDTALLIEFTGCLARSGSVYYAVMVLDKALHFIKNSADIPLALGLLHYREGRIEKAFDMLREARSRNKADPRPYHWLAFISRQRGDIQAAEGYEKEAQKRTPAL
ncbi:hypothetical protein FACS189444_4390 [Spirochaetia bacterium]|nr:hypothetical protein FACS189444_4390 [Spirochaetia bacterium]